MGDDVELRGTDPPIRARVTGMRDGLVRCTWSDDAIGKRITRWVRPDEVRQVTARVALGHEQTREETTR